MSKNNLLSEELKRYNNIVSYNYGLVKEQEEDPFAAAGDEAGAEGGTEEDPFAAAEGGDTVEAGTEGGTEEDPFAAAEGGDTAETEYAGTETPVEPEEETIELDVTDIVQKTEETQSAVEELKSQLQSQSETQTSYIEDIVSKFDSLQQQLSNMDKLIDKVSKIERDIKTPEERLELRSLDSFPFNTKLSDYWSDLASDKDSNYKITNGEDATYELTMDDVSDYSESDIKGSFNPEGGDGYAYQRMSNRY